ncbi:DUF6228 family protein [Microbulbifer elongatus]|uniref:DUF6228 family protein n=1 Tax=Microbulbifer elongatus TaxID=86173 RepID=UPI001CFD7748|nr:DUF6228 family protein [Microbulbifer elongatus]
MNIVSQSGLSVELHSPELDSEGWVTHFCVSLKGEGLEAHLRVYNAPYGENIADFFSALAKDWRGWEGDKEWGSLEGECALWACTDSTGHVTLNIELQSSLCEPFWRTRIALIIEAGQLGEIARQAKRFVYPTTNKRL